jgi:membrane-bound serine protease (ClpP class)
MDFLLDSNIAYLFLLGAVLLVMMALATPATGFFEIGALFCMALAGYAIFHRSFNWWALILIVLSIVPFVYALQKPKREPFLLLSIVLLIIGSVFIFPPSEEWGVVHPLVAILGSTLVAGFLWIAVRKSIEAAHSIPAHSLDVLIGQTGEAKTRVREEGSVQVNGELWSARSEKPIPAGSTIRVVRREGFVLIVEKSSE